MSRRGTARAALGPASDEAVVWHDVECSGYAADLPLWRVVAAEREGPILEVGCGTGRVALELAAAGHDVAGVDSDPELVAALAARARERELRVEAAVADARTFELGRSFGLVVAPMQVAQLLGGADGRRAMLRAVRRHLAPGALFSVALADPLEGLPPETAIPPLPDVREQEGWVFSSAPVAMRAEVDAIVIDRVRQAVSPAGELHESTASIRLDRVTVDELQAIADALGYRALPPREVPATDAYVGGPVAMLEAV